MNWRLVVIGLVCLAGAFLIFITSDVESSDQHEILKADALPASLDQFYPPNTPAPMYQISMIVMANQFTGIVGDVMENDMENAIGTFEAFKKSYIEVAEMVPEWKELYPMEPIEKLGNSISTKDPSQIMPAVEAIGGICHSCHLAYMVPTQHKYRWDNFGDLVLTDPLSGQEVSFAGLMLMMETNFTSIQNDLMQSQNENALKQFAGFNARFEAVSEACMICHDTERLYFVSDDITELISNLQTELSNPQINIDAVGGLIQAIGQESCSKCHLVHIPAAYGQQNMKLY